MSSLKDAVNEKIKSKTTESTSGKKPSYYTKQKQLSIDESCTSPVIEVRLHMAASSHTPTGNLKDMLKVESDKDILSALLQNDSIPVKALGEFLETERADLFNDTDDAYNFVLERIGSTDTK